MPEAVAGAWFGGNIDTTAAVVGAGTIYGEDSAEDRQHRQADPERADRRGGLPAGAVLHHRGGRQEGTAAAPRSSGSASRSSCWASSSPRCCSPSRIPAAPSQGPDAGNAIAAMKDWAFCLAFVCMGLELSVERIQEDGLVAGDRVPDRDRLQHPAGPGGFLADLRLAVPGVSL